MIPWALFWIMTDLHMMSGTSVNRLGRHDDNYMENGYLRSGKKYSPNMHSYQAGAGYSARYVETDQYIARNLQKAPDYRRNHEANDRDGRSGAYRYGAGSWRGQHYPAQSTYITPTPASSSDPVCPKPSCVTVTTSTTILRLVSICQLPTTYFFTGTPETVTETGTETATATDTATATATETATATATETATATATETATATATETATATATGTATATATETVTATATETATETATATATATVTATTTPTAPSFVTAETGTCTLIPVPTKLIPGCCSCSSTASRSEPCFTSTFVRTIFRDKICTMNVETYMYKHAEEEYYISRVNMATKCAL